MCGLFIYYYFFLCYELGYGGMGREEDQSSRASLNTERFGICFFSGDDEDVKLITWQHHNYIPVLCVLIIKTTTTRRQRERCAVVEMKLKQKKREDRVSIIVAVVVIFGVRRLSTLSRSW